MTSQPPAAEHLPAHRSKLPAEIWVLVAAAFIIALGYGLIAPLLPQFVLSFDVSMAAAGLVVSVFSLSRLLFAPVSGSLIDRIGSRKVYLTGLLTVAVTTGLISVASEYWHIVALRAAAGVGSTMFTVSAMGLIVKLAPPDSRGRASAVYGTAFLLGNVIGPVAGAGMSFLGFRWPFVIYGTGVVLAAFVVWWRMPRRLDAAGKPLAQVNKPPMQLRDALSDSAYRAALISNVAHGWVNMGVRVSILPLFAAAVFHAEGAAIAGFALAAFAAGNALVLQFSGKFADTYGRRPLIVAGLIGSGVFISVMGFAVTIPTLMILSVLAGAAAGLLNPSQQAVLADVIGNDRSGGKVLSTYQMAMDLGQIIGPILIGTLADAFGFRIAFASCGLVTLVGIIAWVFGRETLGTREARPQWIRGMRVRRTDTR
ncbi:MFS transporter [Corynebacterium doosanense]|uniref:Arabinose ABC transporter permease n=1 Tax=Corynebacterium doosanense CAU 212 = DSM 45436 TaxID=558173 RepID=A0A097IFA1_9CORY|nr:MFS transporter [Corynebacterium doosanense]AIT60808.1 arabinose ABC transporter permease [Corynebacterium doosanense CAU 212 = DSM 45436]